MSSLWRCEHMHTKEEHPGCYESYLESEKNQTLTEYVKQKGTFKTDHLFFMKDRKFLKLKSPTWNLTIVKCRSKKEGRVLYPVNVNERFVNDKQQFEDRRLKERPIWLDKGDMKLLIEALKLMTKEETETKQGELNKVTEDKKGEEK